ncbi:MAG: sulfite exporter TauE/SafE family protein, partial [Thermodesulfovibrionales bacterium]
VGGGFLMTPLLMMFGISPVVAAATDANQIVAASTSGTYAHWRMGNVDFKMGFHLLIGSFIGGLVGVQLIKILRAMGNADFVIKMTYIVMLGIVGTYMFFESLSALRKKGKIETVKEKKESAIGRFLRSLPFQTHYEKSGVSHSIIVPLSLGGFVGILAAIMGVGGGFLMVPVMVYMLRMPMHVVVGTSLFQILFTCIEVTFLQAYTNHAVDFILAVLLLLGSTIGAQIGAAFGKKLRGEQLRILLASIVLAVTIKIILELTLTPSLLIAQAGGH